MQSEPQTTSRAPQKFRRTLVPRAPEAVPAEVVTEVRLQQYLTNTTLQSLPLSIPVQRALHFDLGVTKATAVQESVIPAALHGLDLVVQADRGAGVWQVAYCALWLSVCGVRFHRVRAVTCLNPKMVRRRARPPPPPLSSLPNNLHHPPHTPHPRAPPVGNGTQHR